MRTLLLADDSVTTQRVVALTFADELFRVVTVSDGQQAMDAMATARPDIVLAGTTLPPASGYELAERMRGIETLRSVPVLLLSGAFESVDMARLEASGARGVIEKPLEPTAVISRVRELLGLKDVRPPAPVGRLVTSADTAADRKAPGRPLSAPVGRKPAGTAWDDLRKETGLEPDARSVEGGTTGSGREDYLDTLGAAFDSLDQHLAGRGAEATPQRNPSGPLGQAGGAADPRSPAPRPAAHDGPPPNDVFEADSDWFADDTRMGDRAASSRDVTADAHEVMPRPSDNAQATPIFEVDEEWFAADEKARAERLEHQRELAAEMGIHDVELPAVEPGVTVPSTADGSDFDFGLSDLIDTPAAPATPAPQKAPLPSAAPPAHGMTPNPVVTAVSTPAAPESPAPAAMAPMPMPPVVAPAAAPVAAASVFSLGSVADDFAALLAFETGDGPEPPPAPAAPEPVAASVPELTDAMLDQIAQRVADRLNAGSFGTNLRDAMTTSLRETVRTVVAETSERLVRDEIARVKAKAERDTQ